MNIDLAGFQLVKVYFLELQHDLMGYFPAIIRSTRQTVLCPDAALLDRVKLMLTDRQHKQGEILMLVDVSRAIGFNLTNDPKPLDEPLPILNDAGFDRLTRDGENPFCWLPGLL